MNIPDKYNTKVLKLLERGKDEGNSKGNNIGNRQL